MNEEKCPFCKSKATIGMSRSKYCVTCVVCGASSDTASTQEEAVVLWKKFCDYINNSHVVF